MSVDNYLRLINKYGLEKKKKPQTAVDLQELYQRNLEEQELEKQMLNEGVSPDVVPTEDEDVQEETVDTGRGIVGSKRIRNTGSGSEKVDNEAIDNSWKAIQQQIKMNTLNSKNEVAIAQRQASKNMDNYLKALGIYGTGMGQTAYTDLASKYTKQLAEINDTERQELLNAQTSKEAEIKEMIKNGADVLTIDEIINELKSEGFNTSTIEQYRKAIGEDILSKSQELYETMLYAMGSNNYSGDATLYNNAIKMLENAIKSGDENQIRDAYKYAFNVANGTPNLNNLNNQNNGSQGSSNTKEYTDNDIQFGTKIYENGKLKYDVSSVTLINGIKYIAVKGYGGLNYIPLNDVLTKLNEGEYSLNK